MCIEKWIILNIDNGFKNHILSLFQKDSAKYLYRNKDEISFWNPLLVFKFLHLSTNFLHNISLTKSTISGKKFLKKLIKYTSSRWLIMYTSRIYENSTERNELRGAF